MKLNSTTNHSDAAGCMDSTHARLKDAYAKLRTQGWAYLPAAGEQVFLALATELGEVVHETDVMVKPDSRGLVTSAKALDFHTDHSKVNYICWLCVQPDDEGGNTILADARKAFSLLTSDDQKTLETVMLEEHCMFKDDLLQCPLVSNLNGKLKFYYSFWLADKNMPERHRRAFDSFRSAVDSIPFDEFKLCRNDVLVVDNSFILHGRRAIKNSNRQLRRFWIRSTFKPDHRGENDANTNHRH